jgi:hypothetical protein
VTANTDTTEDIIQILANLQPYLRKPIIKNKLDNFFKQDNDFQLETITLILKSLPNVDLEKYGDIITTWLEILADFDNTKINHLTRLYLEDLKTNKQLIKTINPLIIDCVKNFEYDKQKKLRNCFLETICMIPFGKNIILSELNSDALSWLTEDDTS